MNKNFGMVLIKKAYNIVNIDIHLEDVYLPDCYEGDNIIAIRMESDEPLQYLEVKRLYIPKGITDIQINNNIFPNLEEVYVDAENKTYSSNGKMIFKMEGTCLAYCPVTKGNRIEIPANVKEIERDAFFGTEYTDIIVGRKEISISDGAFYGSKWLEIHRDMAIIGNTLYEADFNQKALVVPPEVKRFHPKLFERGKLPSKIISTFVPSQNDILSIAKRDTCKSFELNSMQKNINIRLLRKWLSLEEISIAASNKTYKTVDGVVFSKDGKQLLFYPPARKNIEYIIPMGVRKIAENAFANQRYLEIVKMSESVMMVGTAAFFKCKRLREVYFSSNIKDIPDSSVFQMGGVFQDCESLTTIKLPEKLEYLGSYAFAGSGLTSIKLNERLEQIGEYSLMAEMLHRVILPYALKRLGKGSLMYAEYIEVYEGTARGLIGAVNTIPPDSKEKTANILWGRCEIKVLHHRNNKSEDLLIPESLQRSAANHLEMAWNGEHINYEEYDLCLNYISDADEKLEFAEKGIIRYLNVEDNPYTPYLKRIAFKLGCSLLEQKKEIEFLQFLKRGLLSENALSKLLTVSNKQGMTVCAAYIMEMQKKSERTSNRLRL